MNIQVKNEVKKDFIREIAGKSQLGIGKSFHFQVIVFFDKRINYFNSKFH